MEKEIPVSVTKAREIKLANDELNKIRTVINDFNNNVAQTFETITRVTESTVKTLEELNKKQSKAAEELDSKIKSASMSSEEIDAALKESKRQKYELEYLSQELGKSVVKQSKSLQQREMGTTFTRETKGGGKSIEEIVDVLKEQVKNNREFLENLQEKTGETISGEDIKDSNQELFKSIGLTLEKFQEDKNATYIQREEARRAKAQEDLSAGRTSYQQHYYNEGGGKLGRAFGYLRDIANRKRVRDLGTSGSNYLYEDTASKRIEQQKEIKVAQENKKAASDSSLKRIDEAQRRREADKRSDLKDDYEASKPETVKVSDLTPAAISDVETGFTNAIEKTLLPFLKEDFLDGLAKKVSSLGLAAGAMAMGAGADQPPQEEESSWFDWFNGKDKNKNKNKKGKGWWNKAKNAGKWALTKGKSLGRGAWNLGKGAARGTANLARSGASQVAAGASWLGGGMSQALGASSLSSIGTAGSAAIAGAATLAVGTAAAGAAIGYGLEKYGGVGTKTLDALGYGADEDAMQENQEQTNEALKNINEKYKDDPLRKKIATLLTLKAQLIQDGTLLEGEDKEFNEKQIARIEGQIQKKKAELKEKEQGGGKKEELKKETANLVEKNLTEADLEGPPAPEGPPVPEAAPEASSPEPIAGKLGEKKPEEEMYDPEGLLKDETFLEKKGAYDESKEGLKLDIDVSKIPYVEDQKAAYTRAYTNYQASKAKGLSNTQLHARFQAMQRAKNSWQSSEQAYQHLADRGIDPTEMNINQVKQIRNMDVPIFNQEGEHKDISKYVSEDKQEAYKKFFDARKDFDANYEMYDGSDYGDDTPRHWQTLPNAPVLSQPKTKVNEADNVNKDEKQQESVKPELNENNALTAETNQKLDQLIGIMTDKEMGNYSPIVTPGGGQAPSSEGKSSQSVSRAYQFRAQNRPGF